MDAKTVPSHEGAIMEKIVGGVDRMARLVIGPILALVGIAGYAGFIWVAGGPVPQALGSIVIFLVGAILLVTGAVQMCAITRLLGVNMARRDRAG